MARQEIDIHPVQRALGVQVALVTAILGPVLEGRSKANGVEAARLDVTKPADRRTQAAMRSNDIEQRAVQHHVKRKKGGH